MKAYSQAAVRIGPEGRDRRRIARRRHAFIARTGAGYGKARGEPGPATIDIVPNGFCRTLEPAP